MEPSTGLRTVSRLEIDFQKKLTASGCIDTAEIAGDALRAPVFANTDYIFSTTTVPLAKLSRQIRLQSAPAQIRLTKPSQRFCYPLRIALAEVLHARQPVVWKLCK
ncbi:MAG: hypothetical protein OXC07_00255 [Kistimonas sp.]|nr:hypothetical protein [Kistimonas sp.]